MTQIRYISVDLVRHHTTRSREDNITYTRAIRLCVSALWSVMRYVVVCFRFTGLMHALWQEIIFIL